MPAAWPKKLLLLPVVILYPAVPKAAFPQPVVSLAKAASPTAILKKPLLV